MNIPFSPPFVNENILAEVMSSFNSGWITSGPKVKQFETELAKLARVSHVACVNSWTSGAQLVLKWYDVVAGDEVILPAYTYAATALVVMHCGATPVMADVLDDFTIDPESVKKLITPKTKVIFGVDFAGLPCNYEPLLNLINTSENKNLFSASSARQKQLNRILLVSDAAHSIGATVNGRPAAGFCDITIYSFHAVKNVTTAEGGAICLNLPNAFDNAEEYKWMKLNSLNGQTKDAFTKSQAGGWKYDIVSAGLKINMPDICAAIGLAQLRIYESELLPRRVELFEQYEAGFGIHDWAVLPPKDVNGKRSSCHLFALRIKDITEQQRDLIIEEITKTGVSVNVHFIPLPMLSLFRNLGFDIADFPNTYKNYATEISLPIYPQLTNEQMKYIIDSVIQSVEKIRNGRNVKAEQ